MRGRGPMEAETLGDAAAHDMGNTKMGRAKEQDQLVWAEMMEVA